MTLLQKLWSSFLKAGTAREPSPQFLFGFLAIAALLFAVAGYVGS